MSTRSQLPTRGPHAGWPYRLAVAGRLADPAEEVALVARARRDVLLRAHRHRLRVEDLEDCYSQATIELLRRARDGATYASRSHLANTIEQRFLSRVHDRRRALSGRSPMQAAFEQGLPIDGADEPRLQVIDHRREPERLAILRDDLRRLQTHARRLTPDQQLVLVSQVAWQMSRAEFCRRTGWSEEKYRKTAQRGRARLRALMAAEEAAVPAAARPSEENAGTPCEAISPHS